jgi:hypothetical protein
VLYFMTPRPPHPHGLSQDEDERCTSCEQHYGNPQIAARLGITDERGRPDGRSVGQYKRQAVSHIAVTLWPEYYRGKKARAGV